MRLTALRLVGFIAETSMNWDGKVTVPAAREMVTHRSSSGWRKVSNTCFNPSNSSSKHAIVRQGDFRRARAAHRSGMGLMAQAVENVRVHKTVHSELVNC
jgi:hypothetical protein